MTPDVGLDLFSGAVTAGLLLGLLLSLFTGGGR